MALRYDGDKTTINSLIMRMDQLHRNPKEYHIYQIIKCFKQYTHCMKHCMKRRIKVSKIIIKRLKLTVRLVIYNTNIYCKLAPIVYSQIFFNLRQFILNSDGDDDSTFITPYFSHMEQMLRHFEECQSILF